MVKQWVVLVEAASDLTGALIDAREVEALLQALTAGPDGGALHCPERYALQVTTSGSGPAEALVDVLSRWGDAIRQLDLPAREIVRAEVFTPEELERDLQAAQRRASGLAGSRPDREHAEPDDDIGHQLVLQAFSDPLTGLLGREAFAHRLDVALGRASGQRSLAVVCLALDGLQGISERFGGGTADYILRAVAERLSSTLRSRDTLARFGADEYVVVLEDTAEDAAVSVTGRMLESVRSPIKIRGRDFTLSGSAGVVVSHGQNGAAGVVGNAEAALSEAKAAGGGLQVLYGPDEAVPTESARDYRTVAQQDPLAHVRLLLDAGIAANEAQTLHEAAQVVMRQVVALLGCAIGRLWFPSGASEEPLPTSLWHVADTRSYRAFQEATERRPARPGVGLAHRVVASGYPILLSELAAETDIVPREEVVAAGLRSGFAFPVLVGREIVAVFEFFSRTRIEPARSLTDVLAGIGTQLGRVVERQRAASAMRRVTA